MAWLLNFLDRKTRPQDVLKFIAIGYILDIVYSVVALLIVHQWNIPLPEHKATTPIFTWDFPLLLAVAAFVEEFIFRFFPLFLAVFVWGKSWETIATAVITSVIFGYLHGGLWNIPIQGVGGMIFSLLFLKAGGLKEQFGRATFASTSAHFLFNGTIVCLLIALGGNKI